MNDKQRRLIRQFYQSIPTAEDRANFEAIMNAPREERVRLTALLVGKGVLLSPELIDAILAATTLTKQDRIIIFSGVIRNLIYKLFGV